MLKAQNITVLTLLIRRCIMFITGGVNEDISCFYPENALRTILKLVSNFKIFPYKKVSSK